MSETIELTPTRRDPDHEDRPVHIQYGPVKMDLPRLDDSTQLPTAMLIAGLRILSEGWDNLESREKLNFTAVILAWLTRDYPRFERELDKSGDKLADIGRVFAAWADASRGIDPKA